LEEANYNLGIETKSGSADFCTNVDIKNENLIIEGIQQTFPSHEIIGEEMIGTGEIPKLTQNPTWIIDPIGEYQKSLFGGRKKNDHSHSVTYHYH
jgi:fructose-1,6-bisphosphatase/inositol monophosphatase family enzyme